IYPRFFSPNSHFFHLVFPLEAVYKKSQFYFLTTLIFSSAGSRVAFSVSLYTGDNFKCFGPFGVDTVIAYQHIFINLGMAYNMATGVFTVTYPGVYSLAVTSFSDAGSPGNTLAVCTSLQVNGQIVAGSRELNRSDQEDSSTIAVALKLKAGDKVSVKLVKGCFLCDDSSHYNTFSAFLLYADA
uniref:C1q domain-containing protein n=1 Tax=Poecilia mexicana TaxID=48701 RepID=A0A3B3X389_9TELE